TLVPACSAAWLKPHAHGHDDQDGRPRGGGLLARAFARWESRVDGLFASYARVLDVVLEHRVLTVVLAFGLLAGTIVVLRPVLLREFFPEVDAGAFEMYVRAPSGTRIEKTEEKVAQ